MGTCSGSVEPRKNITQGFGILIGECVDMLSEPLRGDGAYLVRHDLGFLLPAGDLDPMTPSGWRVVVSGQTTTMPVMLISWGLTITHGRDF